MKRIVTRTACFGAALVLALSAPALAQQDIPTLTEVGQSAGLDHRFTGPWEFFVGGGGASFDCNGDRRPDLLLAGGTSPAKLYVNQSSKGADLRFEERPVLATEKPLTKVTGAYPINLNNDAHPTWCCCDLAQTGFYWVKATASFAMRTSS